MDTLRILFLDIDGVLNGYPFLDDFQDAPPALDYERWRAMLDPERVVRLNRIIEATDASVVLSSSWRFRWPLEQIQQMLEDREFVSQLIGATGYEPRGRRGHQIAAWLRTHRDAIASYVCLDDDPDMDPVTERWVHTSPDRGGITPAEVDEAIAWLETPWTAGGGGEG